jgi:ATP-dependent exoDNAse (exonuclease V) alpha subunit
MDELVTITGVVEYITFQNTENGYTVLDFSSDGELYTATGNAGSLYCGERVTLTGMWTVHPTFGKQFKIETCRREMPETAAEMLSYLGSGIIKGVKEKTAQKIVERFGEDSFYIIENYPERLAEIKGISKEKLRDILAFDWLSKSPKLPPCLYIADRNLKKLHILLDENPLTRREKNIKRSVLIMYSENKAGYFDYVFPDKITGRYEFKEVFYQDK